MTPDYSGQNLRGRSFKGKDLTRANFNGADIRSADFTGANLTGANFSHAKAGLQKRWAIFLVLVSWVLMGLSGFLSAFAGAIVAALVFDTSRDFYLTYHVAGWTIIVILVIFFFVTIRQGIQKGLGAGVIAGAGAIAVAVTIGVAGSIAGTVTGAGAGAIAVAVAGAVVVAIAGAVAGAGAIAIAIAGSVAGAGAGTIAITVAAAVAGAGARPIAVAVAAAVAGTVTQARAEAGAVAGAGAIVLLSAYISWRTLKGDPKRIAIRSIAIPFAAFKGTSFRSADLTDADFTEATLKSTDFRKANLTRTCFYMTKKLDRVRPGTTYLQKAEVRDVLIKGRVKNYNFDRLNLRGINFKGASLIDASFIGADLSLANLQDTDLSRVKLIQTQLDGTDFTGAILTGAYIQDWGITRDTKFDGVRCKFVYMRNPTLENPDPVRKPDNKKEVFADGEFGNFIKPIVDTLDLYHNQGVDPRAIAISFNQLAGNHPDAELEIVAMEKRDEDKFLLRAKTALDADKSELNAEYFDTYNKLKGLSEEEIRLLLQEQSNEIHNLKKLVQSMLQSSSYTTKTILILTANPKTTTTLRLDEEVREIDVGLKRAKKREEFNLEQCWAVRVRDVSQALLEFEPQIVHFSGHGSQNNGLALEDQTGNIQLVNTEALAELFKLFIPHIECVLLNACYSEVQANAIVRHIPYVIGMNKEIGDQASIEFAIGFYTALGAGKSIEFSYEFGCSAIRLAGIPEHLTPVLKKKQSSF
jgi:uncharacterized protein YjbI with pentapeptide repeats